MRLEFIPVIFLLSLLVIQYFMAKRRATVAGKTVTVVEEEGQKTTANSGTRKTVKQRIKEFAKKEERFWLLGFIVVAAITILLYTVLDDTKSGRWKTVGYITLFGMHVFIFWNFYQALLYEEKLHPATKFFVGGCLIFWSIALFVPNMTQWMVTGTKDTVIAFDEGFKPEVLAGEKATQQSARRAPQAVLKTTTQTLHLEPGRIFKKAEIPSGTKVVEKGSWDCPQGCIVEIEHDGDRLCEIENDTEHDGGRAWYLGTYEETKCRVAIVDRSSNRYREQLLRLPGASGVDFPRNLVRAIVSFGTNQKIGPVDVFVTLNTSH